ncbi:MAG TPA: Lrp/AsnC family transcriptional regulator [Kiloniellaceae bacterium]|nr:Lrp/AsnC family transcriptional regulator [Kiloniellaceae bacterium]
MELDQIDHRILSLLRKDADLPNTSLAERVGLSPSACLRRVARLKEGGVIRRIVALIDPAQLDRRLSAVVTVKLERHGPEFRRDFITRVKAEAAVSQCYMVTGNISCVVILHVADMDEYSALADRLFHADSNVVAFTTYLVMSTLKAEASLAME